MADRETDQFNDLKYVFIDDPVSSLDENHLIELAVDIAELIKSSQSELKFIITTHNPLFYNVLYNEFSNSDKRYNYKPKHSIKRRLEKMSDGTYLLVEQSVDSPFYNRIINLCSHGKHSGEEISLIDDNDKRVLTFLVENIKTTYHFKEQAKDLNENGTI